MARADEQKRKPRIRKSAPTMRERVEAASAAKEEARPNLARRSLAKPAAPFKKMRLGDRKAVGIALKPLKFIKRILGWLIPRYFINAWRELRQVQWPKRRETWRLTLAVFVFAIVFGALVAGVDKGLDEIFKKVVLK